MVMAIAESRATVFYHEKHIGTLMPAYSKEEATRSFVRQFASGSGEQLSWLSRVMGLMFMPRGLMFQPGAENGQPLAPTGRACHLRGFPDGSQAAHQRP